MSWNYRIIKNTTFNTLAIHEVYYDTDGNIDGWTEGPVYLLGETSEELIADLTHMRGAFDKPILVERGRKLVEL